MDAVGEPEVLHDDRQLFGFRVVLQHSEMDKQEQLKQAFILKTQQLPALVWDLLVHQVGP